MNTYKVGDKVCVPSQPEVIEATITSIDDSGVKLNVTRVEKHYEVMYCGFHTIRPLKLKKEESRTIKYCPYCGEKIDIKD